MWVLRDFSQLYFEGEMGSVTCKLFLVKVPPSGPLSRLSVSTFETNVTLKTNHRGVPSLVLELVRQN